MSDPVPPLDIIAGYLNNVYAANAMLAGMQLDLFTPLSQRPYTAAQLAAELQVDVDRLTRLLLALVQAGLLVQDGAYLSATPETAAYLNRRHDRYLAGAADFFAYIWQEIIPHTANTIRQGHSPARHDFRRLPPDEAERMVRLLHPGALAEGSRLARHHDFSAYQTLLDVAGGSGGVAIALTAAYSRLQAIVVELPEVASLAQKFIDEAGLSERIAVISADFLSGQELPGRYDAIVMKAFTQILSPVEVGRALTRAFGLLQPGGDLYIQAAILDDGRTTPEWTVQFDLVLLNLYEQGRAYTEGEYRNWLIDAGFASVRRPDPSLLIASKPA
jgi:precorrin-6B methylase 2